MINLFATPVLIYDNVFNNPKVAADIAEQAVADAEKQPEWDCNISTSFAQSSKMHELHALRPLISVVTRYASVYSKSLFNRDAKVLHSWANVARSGQYQEHHNHLGDRSAFSGVYYPQTPEGENLIMHSPFQNIILAGRQTVNLIPVVTNRLILFPSYLDHSFKARDRDIPKISIAFNFALT